MHSMPRTRASTSARSPVASTASTAPRSAAASSSTKVATDEPPRSGFTAQPVDESARSDSSTAGASCVHCAASIVRPAATRSPASARTLRVQLLHMHSAEPATPEPVCTLPVASRRPWIVPSSPSPPCSARKKTHSRGMRASASSGACSSPPKRHAPLAVDLDVEHARGAAAVVRVAQRGRDGGAALQGDLALARAAPEEDRDRGFAHGGRRVVVMARTGGRRRSRAARAGRRARNSSSSSAKRGSTSTTCTPRRPAPAARHLHGLPSPRRDGTGRAGPCPGNPRRPCSSRG